MGRGEEGREREREGKEGRERAVAALAIGLRGSSPSPQFLMQPLQNSCVKSKVIIVGQLILRKVLKIVATICLDFSSKCTKMRLAAGLRPDPLGS